MTFKTTIRLLTGVLCLLSAALPSPAAEKAAPAADDAGSALELWYTKPAEKWTDALPVGSGRLGAMVFGGTVVEEQKVKKPSLDEHIQFNEDTLWTGKPNDYSHPGAFEHLAEIRKLVADGKPEDAANLVRKTFLSIPVRQRAYQPFGDLRLQFPGQEKWTDYRRSLDLDSAVASVSYKVDGVRFERKVFASYPDGVIVVHLSADQPGRLSFALKMDTPHKVSTVKAIAADTLALTGQVQDPKRSMYDKSAPQPPKMQADPPGPVQTDGLKFEARLRVAARGGTVTVSDAGVNVDKADSVTFVLAAATSFKNYKDITGDPAKSCEATLAKVSGKSFDALLATHTADHRKLFRRVALDLGGAGRSDTPTDERIDKLKKPKEGGIAADTALAALHFQYGRYLLIASSRPGTQAANLQGVWNDLIDPPWESKYTTNINAEMNYWPAEVTNLSECHEPLFDLAADCVEPGRQTAKVNYNAGGWVLHHNTDLWRGTAPINNIDGLWPTGGAWLCHHLWEHYLFTGDKEFLAKRAYPVMKEASAFFFDFLIKDAKTGWLVSTPTHSPEQGGLVAGCAMDHQLIRALFDYTTEAANILGVDKEFVAKVAEVRGQLAPDQVGKHGQLQEWVDDIDQPNNNHRHMSPLWCLYPGFQYTPLDPDPKLYNAVKQLLDWRGDGSTGWSFAWRVNLRARTGEGDAALRQLEMLLQRRTLPNLFDLCGPFQIDGNFGGAAGVAEMLLQSHYRAPDSKAYVIQLLPALPKAWAKGSITGLCARGAFDVDVEWDGGKLKRAVIRSRSGMPCKVNYAGKTIDLATEAGKQYAFDGELKPAK